MRGLGQKFFAMHQRPVKMKLSAGNAHTQFPKAAQQIFFHLSRHARLLGAFAAWSVGIGVGWESPI